MSLHRWAAKRDASEPAIVQALEALGWSVLRISVMHGPDLVVAKGGFTAVIEVKTKAKKLRPGQATWAAGWRGAASVIRTVEEALAFNLAHGTVEGVRHGASD